MCAVVEGGACQTSGCALSGKSEWMRREGTATSLRHSLLRRTISGDGRTGRPPTCVVDRNTRRICTVTRAGCDIDRAQLRKEAMMMARKQVFDKLSVCVPQSKLEQRPIERLIELGKKRDRSVNYLVIEAVFGYLSREEAKN